MGLSYEALPPWKKTLLTIKFSNIMLNLGSYLKLKHDCVINDCVIRF